jgi:hypothetical protein
MEIKLSELWSKAPDELPDWIYSEWCIYKILNLINNKMYIGQAKNFYGRFTSNGFNHLSAYRDFCEDGGNSYLYSAIKFHHPENFTVSIIDFVPESSENKRDDLNDLESKWISELHTCVYDENSNGYNMTYGGEDAANLHQVEVIQTRLIHKIQRAFNILSEKKLDITPRNYCTESGFSSIRFAGNHIELVTEHYYDTPSIKSHSLWTDQMSEIFDFFNEIESWDQIKKILGIECSQSYLINEIKSRLQRLHDIGLPLTPENYIFKTGFYSYQKALGHVDSILSRFHIEYPITADPRWTDEMNQLFCQFDSNPNFHDDIYKLAADHCN